MQKRYTLGNYIEKNVYFKIIFIVYEMGDLIQMSICAGVCICMQACACEHRCVQVYAGV